jgi:hypothetical protein
MNWVKENKFLTGFLIVMLIGVGALGYKVYSASSDSDDATTAYTQAATEYSRLRHLIPYPSKKNLDTYEDRKKDAAQVIDAFEASLAKNEFPLVPLTPEGFQDKLKAAVTDVKAKAQDANVKLPEKDFFLGFEKYQGTPPTTEAAAPLGRQLEAIKWVVGQYIANSVLEIRALIRTELPEERGGGSERQTNRPGGPRPGGGGPGSGGRTGAGGDRSDLVKYYPFRIQAVCRQPKIAAVLDAISGKGAPQFYVLRRIQILNQNPKGPSKSVDPNKPEKGVEYIVGQEVNEFTAEYDIVDFTPPEVKAAAPDKSAPAPAPAAP